MIFYAWSKHTRLVMSSGVARIFSVGGHWGALGFRRGALKFWADKPPPPPPPPKKKKKKKKNPHLKSVLIFRRNKLTIKKRKKKRKEKVITSVGMGSSVASFVVLGGGGRASPPNVPTEYICIHTINAVPFYYLWHMRYIRQYNGKKNTTHWEKSMNMRASELRKFPHIHILKLLFPSIFCWYLWYFVSETYFQVSNYICIYYTINAVFFYYLWYGTMYINDSTPTKH